ncbi:hypothetical protein Taro_017317 [Colocasia esculenta]|uniref:Secreted protein n=1 Tax=Colocasia esculenta TaxID=4460 RepID=A0A843UZ06_COLES|nr:hypothetical protein [Colocasia esculenta]
MRIYGGGVLVGLHSCLTFLRGAAAGPFVRGCETESRQTFPTEPVTREAHPYPHRIWLRVAGVVFLLVMASRGEMSLGVRIRVSSRPLHPTVLYFPHRHQ